MKMADFSQPIMSFEFEREPAEHAQVMREVGNRIAKVTSSPQRYLALAQTVFFAILMANAILAYHHFLLPAFLPSSQPLPTLNEMLIIGWPLMMLPVLAFFIFYYRTLKKWQKNMIRRLKAQHVLIEISSEGLATLSGGLELKIEWPEVENILILPQRIDFDTNGFFAYIPKRAFRSTEDFQAKSKEMIALWQKTRAEGRK